ncbi:hypothetical protein [Roseibacillus ishigakijimensis]|uniref:Entericidin EcnAB n=1 Tax=Roseibacillus ishigakijimensis TaxID=454146 RepID=A0A934VNL3_9BACT|nr:hypothetical protein [Roseibacillus ishigakijimensis]MBK1835201.1 hypothetical protein [Roseibacillus ishigakijimensis]
MKTLTISTLAILGFALASCNTARSVGNAAGGAVKATGETIGDAAEGTVDAGKKVGSAVGQDVKATGRAISGE